MNPNLIYTNPHSISKQLCDEIIHLYELEDNRRYSGITAGGLDKNVKDTTDFMIPHDKVWGQIHDFLATELKLNIKMYFDNLNNNKIQNENSSRKFKIFADTETKIYSFMMQRYIKQVGRYVYHNDAQIDWNNKEHRMVTFLWYLNTVNEGGETEIWGETKIKPEAGKLLLFPACWTFPHSGKMPISDNKYIITGWIYVKD
jgi:hypothetical protein